MSSSRFSKHGWNRYNTFGCYAILLPLRNTHDASQGPLCESIKSSKELEVKHITRGQSHVPGQHAQTIPATYTHCRFYGSLSGLAEWAGTTRHIYTLTPEIVDFGGRWSVIILDSKGIGKI